MSCLLQNPTGLPYYYHSSSLSVGLVMEPRKKCQPLDPYQQLKASANLLSEESSENSNWEHKVSPGGLSLHGSPTIIATPATEDDPEDERGLESHVIIRPIAITAERLPPINTMPGLREELDIIDHDHGNGHILTKDYEYPSFKIQNEEPEVELEEERFTMFRSPIEIPCSEPTSSSFNSSRSSSIHSLTQMNANLQIQEICRKNHHTHRRHSLGMENSTAPSTSTSTSSSSNTSNSSTSSSSLTSLNHNAGALRQRSLPNNIIKAHPYAFPRKFSAFTTLASRPSQQGTEPEYFGSIYEMNQDDGNQNPRDTAGTSGSASGLRAQDANTGLQFIGPIGKKRKLFRDRQISSEGQEENSTEDSSDATPGYEHEIIQEEGEIFVQDSNLQESEEPLNLCIGDEAEVTLDKVKHLSISCQDEILHYSDLQLPQLKCVTSPNRPGPSSRPSIIKKHTSSRRQSPQQSPSPKPSTSQSLLRDHLIATTRQYANRIPYIPQQLRENLDFDPAVVGPEPAAETSGKKNQAKRKLQCPECGKEFSQLRNYRYHRSRHEGTSQFACTCPICGKKFNDKGYLSSHLKIHRNAKEYKCEWCEKCFNQRVAYNMHIRIHTGLKPHHCSVCPKSFSRKMLLRQHLRTHTGERPYSCDVCGKAFADRSNMLLHQRLHSGERPYKCDQCGKSFSKNHHLKTHLNHHAGIKPYQCEKCKACFSQSSNMKTHFRKCTGMSGPALMPTIPEEFGMLGGGCSGSGSHLQGQHFQQLLSPPLMPPGPSRRGRGTGGSLQNMSPNRQQQSLEQLLNLNLSPGSISNVQQR